MFTNSRVMIVSRQLGREGPPVPEDLRIGFDRFFVVSKRLTVSGDAPSLVPGLKEVVLCLLRMSRVS